MFSSGFRGEIHIFVNGIRTVVDDNPYAGELSELRDIAKAAKFDLEFKSIEESDSDVDERMRLILRTLKKGYRTL